MITKYIAERVVVHGLDGQMYIGTLRAANEGDWVTLERAWQVRLIPSPQGVGVMPTPIGLSGAIMNLFNVRAAAIYGDNDMSVAGRKTLDELETQVRAMEAGLATVKPGPRIVDGRGPRGIQ